jgi:hypothetical protein
MKAVRTVDAPDVKAMICAADAIQSRLAAQARTLAMIAQTCELAADSGQQDEQGHALFSGIGTITQRSAAEMDDLFRAVDDLWGMVHAQWIGPAQQEGGK